MNSINFVIINFNEQFNIFIYIYICTHNILINNVILIAFQISNNFSYLK